MKKILKIISSTLYANNRFMYWTGCMVIQCDWCHDHEPSLVVFFFKFIYHRLSISEM